MSSSETEAKGTNAATTTVRKVIALATGWLEKKGVDAPRLDAELLLARVLGLKRLQLYLDHDRPLEERELEPFRALLKRRAAREPIAYVLGEREFGGLRFELTKDVLVPRPETEELVELVQAELSREKKEREIVFADVGTGSGCIAVALVSWAKEKAIALRGFATDRSQAALFVARANAEKLGASDKLDFVVGDLLSPLKDKLGEAKLDLVVSNPPYVLESERGLLDPELAFEPASALFDADGLPLTKRLAAEARALLAPGGLLAVETGAGRAELVRGHFLAAGLERVESRKDLAGHERFVLGRTPA